VLLATKKRQIQMKESVSPLKDAKKSRSQTAKFDTQREL